ncbi:hypothetical protein R3P38DRAFT_3560378 [Favolaschia claudopus]|uniref:Uncharacterized protein n=1 Tax=Favolaschia claudopus TaxID=2862362 RepID=A0AAW0AXR4_9AGAR
MNTGAKPMKTGRGKEVLLSHRNVTFSQIWLSPPPATLRLTSRGAQRASRSPPPTSRCPDPAAPVAANSLFATPSSSSLKQLISVSTLTHQNQDHIPITFLQVVRVRRCRLSLLFPLILYSIHVRYPTQRFSRAFGGAATRLVGGYEQAEVGVIVVEVVCASISFYQTQYQLILLYPALYTFDTAPHQRTPSRDIHSSGSPLLTKKLRDAASICYGYVRVPSPIRHPAPTLPASTRVQPALPQNQIHPNCTNSLPPPTRRRCRPWFLNTLNLDLTPTLTYARRFTIKSAVDSIQHEAIRVQEESGEDGKTAAGGGGLYARAIDQVYAAANAGLLGFARQAKAKASALCMCTERDAARNECLLLKRKLAHLMPMLSNPDWSDSDADSPLEAEQPAPQRVVAPARGLPARRVDLVRLSRGGKLLLLRTTFVAVLLAYFQPTGSNSDEACERTVEHTAIVALVLNGG